MDIFDTYLESEGSDDPFGSDLALIYDDAYGPEYDGLGESFDVGFGNGDDVASMHTALRWTLHDECGDADDVELSAALNGMFESMSAAESLNFGSALSQIGRGLTSALSDPTVSAITHVALPIVGGAVGTVIGGPIGTALGSQLGTIAAGSLPGHPGPVTRPPVAPSSLAAPPLRPAGTPTAGAAGGSPVAGGSVAGGSAAAAQALVLTQHPQILQALLAAALGEHGRTDIGGIPATQLLGMLHEIVGQAAADADELHYVRAADSEATAEWEPDDDAGLRTLYLGLLDADNLELAETFGADELDGAW